MQVGISPHLSYINAALQTQLCFFWRYSEMALGSKDFEVSLEGQQGAALQAQESLCTLLKPAQS